MPPSKTIYKVKQNEIERIKRNLALYIPRTEVSEVLQVATNALIDAYALISNEQLLVEQMILETLEKILSKLEDKEAK